MSMNNFSIKYWMMAVRPKTLSASIAPVLFAGTICYESTMKFWVLWLCCFVVAVSLQIAANLANDYCDGKSGLDDSRRLGPRRVSAEGLILPLLVKLACFAFIGLAASTGLFAAWLSSWLILIPGAFCLLFAWWYSSGPFPLAYWRMGELAAFIFFGLIPVCGSCYVLTGTVSLVAIVSGGMFGLFAAAIMAVNNLRDRITDIHKSKKTIATTLSEHRARVFTAGLFIAGCLLPALVSYFSGRKLLYFSLVVLISGIILSKKILSLPVSKAFNGILAGVSLTELLTSVILSFLWFMSNEY